MNFAFFFAGFLSCFCCSFIQSSNRACVTVSVLLLFIVDIQSLDGAMSRCMCACDENPVIKIVKYSAFQMSLIYCLQLESISALSMRWREKVRRDRAGEKENEQNRERETQRENEPRKQLPNSE